MPKNSLFSVLTDTVKKDAIKVSFTFHFPSHSTSTSNHMVVNSNQKNFYSSLSSGNRAGSNNRNINSSFIDDQLLLFLPPLCVSFPNDFSSNKSNEDEFVKVLVGILGGLDKSYLYKLEYSLFSHTNSEDKKLVYYFPPISGLGDNKGLPPSKEVMFKYALFQRITFENYKYHGYHVFKSDYIDLNKTNFSDYSTDVFNYLEEDTTKNNEDLSLDLFIEFKKSSLLNLTRFNRLDKNNKNS